jgi:hypothetical protein
LLTYFTAIWNIFTDIWYILWPFGTFCVLLVHLFRFWYNVQKNLATLMHPTSSSLDFYGGTCQWGVVCQLEMRRHLPLTFVQISNLTCQRGTFSASLIIFPGEFLWPFFLNTSRSNLDHDDTAVANF